VHESSGGAGTYVSSCVVVFVVDLAAQHLKYHCDQSLRSLRTQLRGFLYCILKYRGSFSVLFGDGVIPPCSEIFIRLLLPEPDNRISHPKWSALNLKTAKKMTRTT